MLVRHGTEHAVTDTFKLIISSLCDGSKDFKINVGTGQGEIHIACYCINPKHVGVLLGKSYDDNGIKVRTPTKIAILRLLSVVARRNNYESVTLRIEDISKLKESEDNGKEQ